MGYNVSDEGGTAVGGGDFFNSTTWTFTLTKGEGIASGGGDFNEDQLPILGVPEIDESLLLNEYEFSDPTGEFADAITLTVDGTGTTGGGTNQTGIYSFTVDFSQITENTTIEIAVTGRRLDESGTVVEEDENTIVIDLLICIARGTHIETESGPVPVERLAIGDRVRMENGRIEPVRWIGSRILDREQLAAMPHLRPIRIAQGALGDGQPDRDLLVSPQHRVLLRGWKAELLFGEDEVLAPAKGLVNDSTITIDHDAGEIEYFHLMFSKHEVIMTNNLPTESFFPGKTSLNGIDRAAREELFRILPELADEADAYGPMAEPGLRTWEARTLRTPRTRH